jgi:hypothetical protein
VATSKKTANTSNTKIQVSEAALLYDFIICLFSPVRSDTEHAVKEK